MKRIFLRLVAIATASIAATLGGCSANPPIIDYDRSVDFSGYKTFAFISDHPLMVAEGSSTSSPLLEGRLMRITEDVLRAKGFTIIADAEAADFAVGFTVGARDKIKVNSYPEPYHRYYGGWGGWGAPYYGSGFGGGSNVDVQQYVEGTLAFDIYDVSEHKPAWHGVATKRITDSMRRNPDESLTEAVNEILAGFPPGSLTQ